METETGGAAPVAPPAAAEPIWFVEWARGVVHTLLHDRDRTMGWIVVGLSLAASFLATGGVIPGTTIAVPVPAQLARAAAAVAPLLGTWALKLAVGSRNKLSPEHLALLKQLAEETAAAKRAGP